MRGFLSLYPFQTFYLADLNAIMGAGRHDALIAEVLASYPTIEFWIDNGSQLNNLQPHPAKNSRNVIGTESQLAPNQPIDQDCILSLDFKHDLAAGNPAWFTDSCYWPQQVIIMTLSRVGGNVGPDFQKLADYAGLYPDKNIIAAGGVRDVTDLNRLQAIAVSGALLASALHAGKLSASDIEKLRTKKYPGKPGYF